MRITRKHFNSILLELIDDNPIACRGILRVSRVVFTKAVPTMGITTTGSPKLCVNLDFVKKYCRTEAHVKAVIVHEFLHVLLNHTEKFKRVTPSLNLALDAVINAIIHRTLGAEYSGMMSSYYAKSKGNLRLLRPMDGGEEDDWKSNPEGNELFDIWASLYQGRLVADDLLDIAEIIGGPGEDELGLGDATYLGNHTETLQDVGNISPEVETALAETLSSIRGGEIWRNPINRGVGVNYGGLEISEADRSMQLWEREAVKVLTQCVTPDRSSPAAAEAKEVTLPVLNEGDKRGFLRSLWSPFLPDMVWRSEKKVRRGTTQIYLDVSGSMNVEMDALVALIWRLRRHVRLPFWAFSDTVEPAEIRNGRLVTATTGGTSMDAVLRHVAETRPGKAVVITDGYIEECDRDLLRAVSSQDIRAIVSSDGSTDELERTGIPYSQLGRFAYDQNR
ncbi:MAG: VWA domain-containing protein [bacterium]|nr:VWA domain-containing protein [bacterium]